MKKIQQWAIYDPIHYAYKGRYIKGRMLGNVLAGMIVAASLIVGYLTREVIIDTVVCAFTFGNYLRNLGIMVMLRNMGKRDYYVYDKFASCDETIKEKRVGIYDEMIKRGHRITLSAGFFELYFPFLLIIILPSTPGKVVIPLMFVIGTTIIKIMCNPVKNVKCKRIFRFDLRYNPTYIHQLQPKAKSHFLAKLLRRDIYFRGFYISGEEYYRILIAMRAIFISAPFYASGLMLSFQTRFPVKVFEDLRVLIPILFVGIFYNFLQDCKVYSSYKRCKGRITFAFINQIVANYFGIKTWGDVYEQRRKEEQERKRQEAEKNDFSKKEESVICMHC